MSAAISTQELTKRFRNNTVLNGLTLEIPEGSIFGLLGANGAGKTTTLKILMNFLQSNSGSAKLLGVDSRRITPKELARIGYVAESQELPAWMTVGYYLNYLKPFYPKWDETRAADWLRAFDLPVDRKLGDLSRGMRMKASLISSLAYRPSILILDEPFSGLDPATREDLIQALIDSAEETTILLSSHDLAEIETFASHIGYLDHGRLQFSEEMNSLMQRFRSVEVVTRNVTLPIEEWPATWLQPQMGGSVVRFIESQFDSLTTPLHLSRVFGEIRETTIAPMPLRSIFVALARRKQHSA